MQAVVIDRITGNLELAAKAVAEALGKTLYEVRPTVRVPAGGPAVVAVLANLDAANETGSRLQAAGFEVRVVDASDPLPGAVVGRHFELDPDGVTIDARDGQRVVCPFPSVEALVHAMEASRTAQTQTVTERKLDIGRAVLSGGLVNTRTERRTRTTTKTDAEELLLIFAGDLPPLVLREHELTYQSLGEALQPSRSANFRYLVTRIRQGCPGAAWDERLMRQSTQSQILGPMLSPEAHFPLVAALVAASLRHR